jgi:hypothetical protein
LSHVDVLGAFKDSPTMSASATKGTFFMLTQLDRSSIGYPITRRGVSFFPVYLTQSAPMIATGNVAGVTIAERPDAEVPTIVVHNASGKWVLVPAGTVVTGGRQNRTLNVSVLAPANSELEVPVSCVEAGRWSGGGEFGLSGMFASRRVRRVMQRTVAENLRQGHRGANQGQVWDAVRSELTRLSVHSDTSNFSDIESALRSDDRVAATVDELVAKGPLPGQVGVVVCHGSRVVSADLFATPDMLACHWDALVRSVMLEAGDGPRTAPSATKVLKFLRSFAVAKSVVTPGAGAGREHHVDTDRIAGQALVLDDVLVHASMFAVAA